MGVDSTPIVYFITILRILSSGEWTQLLISLFSVTVFENKEKIIIVMEYADGGELYDHISNKGRLTEKEARKIFRQIISAMHHLHEVRKPVQN